MSPCPWSPNMQSPWLSLNSGNCFSLRGQCWNISRIRGISWLRPSCFWYFRAKLYRVLWTGCRPFLYYYYLHEGVMETFIIVLIVMLIIVTFTKISIFSFLCVCVCVCAGDCVNRERQRKILQGVFNDINHVRSPSYGKIDNYRKNS